MEHSGGTNEARAVRVFVINDSPIFTEALRRFFLAEPWIDQAGSATFGPGMYPAVADAQPDVIIIDPGHRHATLPDLLGQLRAWAPRAGLLVLSMDAGSPTPDGLPTSGIGRDWAIAAGAEAFVAKEQATEELLGAVRRLAGRWR